MVENKERQDFSCLSLDFLKAGPTIFISALAGRNQFMKVTINPSVSGFEDVEITFTTKFVSSEIFRTLQTACHSIKPDFFNSWTFWNFLPVILTIASIFYLLKIIYLRSKYNIFVSICQANLT